MKNKTITISLSIFTIILVLATSSMVFINKKYKQHNKYCNQFSGFYNYTWGGTTSECWDANCVIRNKKIFDDPNSIDEEGYSYDCVADKKIFFKKLLSS